MVLTVRNGPPRVAVLLATRNGAAFLSEQLDTIERQSAPLVDLWASDDGSTDTTRNILAAASSRWTKGRVEIAEGPRKGLAENFRSLLRRDDIDADFVAFSDQDDIWRPDKLSNAIAWLGGQDAAQPALYCSRVELVDAQGRSIGFSPLFAGPTDLRNALVQSLAGGNTMVMNRAAHRLLREAADRAPFVIHDWWAYILVTAAGGRVHYSPKADVLYRQHGGNMVGSNVSWASRFQRLRPLMGGRFARWTDQNLAGLSACRNLVSPQNLALIDEFDRMRQQPLLRRLSTLRRLGLHRQTRLGQLSLYAACALNRL
ncbi:MAG: glycosyltransferase family 2 protein [Rhizobiaceae bacterium]